MTKPHTLKIVSAQEAHSIAQHNGAGLKYRILGQSRIYPAITKNPLHGMYGLQYFDDMDNFQEHNLEDENTLIEILSYLDDKVDLTDYVDVVFRRWRSQGKELIALFPHTIADTQGYKCQSYMHVGQHSAANYLALLSATRLVDPQTDPEARDLIKELQGIGYKLQFVRKVNHTKLRKARKEFRESR